MLKPKDMAKLDEGKINLDDIERKIDTSIRDFHGDYEWEEAIINGEYPDNIMTKICLRYKKAGWKHIYWSKSSEIEKAGLTQIVMSAKKPIPDTVTKNMHKI